MSYSETNTWERSSWREVGPKYCKVCGGFISLGSKVRFSYSGKRGLCHESCANMDEEDREAEVNDRIKTELEEARAHIGKPIPRGDLISPEYLAKYFGVSVQTINNYLTGRSRAKDDVRQEMLKLISGWDKHGNRLYWPGRFMYLLGELLRLDNILYDTWLTKNHFNIYGYSIENTIEISGDNRVVFYREQTDEHSFAFINYRASHLAGRKIKGAVLICTKDDWEELQKHGKLIRRLPQAVYIKPPRVYVPAEPRVNVKPKISVSAKPRVEGHWKPLSGVRIPEHIRERARLKRLRVRGEAQ